MTTKTSNDEAARTQPLPTIGRIVHYRLTAEDAAQINRRRTDGASIASRISQDRWPKGAQAHIGNQAVENQVFPALVVNTFGGDTVNLKVELDGTDSLWKTSAPRSADGELRAGEWQWPTKG